VTPQTDQRQALITEIDTVLSKTQSRLPWVMAGEVSQQRGVLRRVREYLASLPTSPTQRPSTKGQLPPSNRPTPPSRRRRSLLGADLSQESQPTPQLAPENSANQQIVQAVVQDLRSSILMPLQQEIAALQSQREQMRQELQYLDQQRRNNSMSGQSQKMMTEFFQTLIDRCAESLTQQVAQNLADLQVELLQYRPPEPHDPILAPDSSADPSLLTPQERLEQLRALQAQSDKLLKTLDASINVVFETLQSNLQSYSESMTEGIEHMYTLGQQGEVMFSALVNRLASQLGREASSYIQKRPEDSPALDQTSEGKSLSPSAIAPESDRPAQNTPTPSVDVAQEKEPPQDREEPENLEDFEPESIGDEEPEEGEEIEDLDEEITLEFFEQFEAPEESVEITEELDEQEEDQESQASSPDVEQESGSDIEGDEFYDALFASDQFTTGDIPDALESDDPLQELTETAADPMETEPEPEEEPAEEEADREAIAETLESDLFAGLGDSEEPTEEPEQDRLATQAAPEPEDLASTASVVESSLFEGDPPPSQVEDPVSLETFMELFGDEEASPQIGSEALETNWGSESPLETTEDIYIPASPDEVLLPTEEEENQEVSQLNLQGEVLEQLSQDLFSLEGEGEPPIPAPTPEEQVEDLFGNLEPASAEASPPDDEAQDDTSTENFLNEILATPDSGTAAEEPEPGVRVDNLFEGFAQEPELEEVTPEEEPPAPFNPLWEAESEMNVPESLTIDTVFDEEFDEEPEGLSETLEEEEPGSVMVENGFEENDEEERGIDPSVGRSPKSTSTIENIFEGFSMVEELDLEPPAPPSSPEKDEANGEEPFTLDDVFEGFPEDDDPDARFNS